MEKSTEQERICQIVREIKSHGFSTWQISKLIGDLVSPRTIERWVAGHCPPRNTKAVIAPLENLLTIVNQNKKTQEKSI